MEMGFQKGKETEKRKCLGQQKSSRTTDHGLGMRTQEKDVPSQIQEASGRWLHPENCVTKRSAFCTFGGTNTLRHEKSPPGNKVGSSIWGTHERG